MTERESRDRARYGAALARRVAQWEAGGAALNETEAARYLSGADPDLVLISDYLDGALDDVTMSNVERRLREDEEFQKAVRPFLQADEALRGEGRLGGVVRALSPVPSVDAGVAESTTVPTTRRARLRLGWALVCAAVVALILGGGWLQIERRSRAREEVAERASGRAVTSHLWFRGSSNTGPGQTLAMQVPPGVIVSHEYTRLTSGVDLGNLGKNPTAMDGEVDVTVRKQAIYLTTATAEIDLNPGSYRVTSVPGSGVTSVVVHTGRARVRRIGSGEAMTSVGPQHEAVVDRRTVAINAAPPAATSVGSTLPDNL